MCAHALGQYPSVLRRSPRLSGRQRARSTGMRHLRSSMGPVSVPTSGEVGPSSVRLLRNESEQSNPGPSGPRPNLNSNALHRNSARGAMLDLPCHVDVENVRASCSQDVDGLYTFLFRMNVRALRGLLKEMKLKQSGKKEILLARIVISADIRFASGESLANFMACYHETARFNSWWQHQIALDERVPQYWLVAPSVSYSLSLLDATEAESFKENKADVLRSTEGPQLATEEGQRTADNSGSSAGNESRPNTAAETPSFSIDEFARLCIIIRDDEDAKAALFATGQELTRSQMDTGFSRDSFWGVIEGRFNDPELRLHLNTMGNVDDVDSAIVPPVRRSASFLKEIFFDARSSFTVCVENWSKSGQNNNSNFKQFAGLRGRELTAAGKRNMILFICARMGTENEDSRFRSMCSRVIPCSEGTDESGPTIRDESERSRRKTERPSSRRESHGNQAADNESARSSMVQLSEFIIQGGREKDHERRLLLEEKLEEHRERRQQRREQHEEFLEAAAERRKRRKRRHGHHGGLHELERNHELIKLLRYATEILESQGQDPGTELIIATKRHKEAVCKALQMLQNSL